MRNSRNLVIILFLVSCLLINSALNYLLIPNNIMRIKMHNLESTTYDDLFLGTSHGLSAVDPLVVDEITGRESTNLCVWGEYPRDTYYLLRDAWRFQKPKRIIYELDPTYWISQDQNTYHFSKFYYYMSWSEIKAEYFLAKITSADFRTVFFPWFNFQLQWPASIENLALKQTENYRNYGLDTLDLPYETLKEEGFLYLKDTKLAKSKKITLWDEKKIQKEAPIYFDKIVTFCKENDIELLIFTTPVAQETLDLYPESYEEANQYFSNLMKEYGIPYYNFNYIQLDGFDKSLANFTDYDGHMLGDTARTFSKYLGEFLR